MAPETKRQMPAGEPLVLSGMIDYSEGSVVSKQLTKSKAGNLTLFAFDVGEGLSEHTAPFDAVVQILDGKAELTIDGENVIAEAGQTVLMPANIPHSLQAHERFKMLLIMIRG
jgi:quercetin dioxygenase-like cupin family protein